ncbi:PREDICTED: carbon catabolite repressor protein 4 homolog 5 isoform X2 [Camelina sativa]|uniref:Carbon catabolite repressor protein 4 homolog 5 isoform X2 n=1 Tax=Camelina sativa TaxID=90675 RepID=A0ABM0WIA3_CAMSA|nr:PREDICTED: carbon catabolite repressor protein 4 homolog 5 isoform X2 [Camelina sativa]
MSKYERKNSTGNSTTVTKRKRCSISESSYRHESITLKPHRPLAPGSSWRSCKPVRPGKSSRRRRKRTKEIISSSGEREWVFSATNFENLQDKVVLVSYNLLGVDNASNHMDLYYNVPPKHLEWSRRKHLICKEISRYNASILCLQEVDRFDDLDGLLKTRGFQGVHKSRTGEASDGCAIFWKEKLFKLLDYQHIEFDRFDMRNNVAQLCVLEVRLFLEKAYQLSQEWGNIPVVIAGDLNSTPQSAIYDFIASADLDTQLHNRRQISGQSEMEPKKRSFRNRYAVRAAVSTSGSLPNVWSKEELQFATGGQASTHVQHQLKLHSAYSGVPGTHRTRDQRGEPLATTYHSRFLGTVDYIWHTKELVPVRVLETLPTDVLTRTCGLPSEKWGSDHLAIACELGFVND